MLVAINVQNIFPYQQITTLVVREGVKITREEPTCFCMSMYSDDPKVNQKFSYSIC